MVIDHHDHLLNIKTRSYVKNHIFNCPLAVSQLNPFAVEIKFHLYFLFLFSDIDSATWYDAKALASNYGDALLIDTRKYCDYTTKSMMENLFGFVMNTSIINFWSEIVCLKSLSIVLSFSFVSRRYCHKWRSNQSNSLRNRRALDSIDTGLKNMQTASLRKYEPLNATEERNE